MKKIIEQTSKTWEEQKKKKTGENMTNQEQFQKELKEIVKEGIKPSTVKKLKRSKSADDIPASSAPIASIPLRKSNSHLEIPVIQQPTPKEQITNLKDQVKFHSETAANYLQSLQTSQAKVSELEKRLKTHPPNQLLSDQLTQKQQEVESLREQLEEKNQELKTLKTEQSNLLDTNLTLKHQGLKDWWQQYEQTQKLEQELVENVDYASNELLNQDKVIERLRIKNSNLQQEKQSLQKDLDLAQKLAELRRIPLPDDNKGWTEYLKLAFYSFCAVAFTLWVTNNLRNQK